MTGSPRDVRRALANFPKPVERFDDPLGQLEE